MMDGEFVIEFFEDKDIKIKNILNSVKMLNWLENKNYKVSLKTLNEAVNIDVLNDLIERGIYPEYSTLISAVECGHLEKIKWLVGIDNFESRLYENEDVDTIKRCHEELCAEAALGGHLEILKLFREKNYEWNHDVCSYAALNGHIEILEWARKQGCEWDSVSCSCAAMHGHLEVLKWAYEHGCEYDIDKIYENAEENGHIKILDWIDEISI